MTRSEKVKKLANAIKDYRGSYHAKSGAWIRAPRVKDWPRVEKWLDELDVPMTPELKQRIDTFEKAGFHELLKEVETR